MNINNENRINSKFERNFHKFSEEILSSNFINSETSKKEFLNKSASFENINNG